MKRNDTIDASNLSIVYIMLIHDNEDFAIRIIDALDEPMHSFIIHVDIAADEVQAYLMMKLKDRKNVYILNKGRELTTHIYYSISSNIYIYNIMYR